MKMKKYCVLVGLVQLFQHSQLVALEDQNPESSGGNSGKTDHLRWAFSLYSRKAQKVGVWNLRKNQLLQLLKKQIRYPREFGND